MSYRDSKCPSESICCQMSRSAECLGVSFCGCCSPLLPFGVEPSTSHLDLVACNQREGFLNPEQTTMPHQFVVCHPARLMWLMLPGVFSPILPILVIRGYFCSVACPRPASTPPDRPSSVHSVSGLLSKDNLLSPVIPSSQ